MAIGVSFWFLAVLSCIAGTQARVVQDDFVSPSLPDESVTIRAGTTYTIEWTGQLYTWFSSYAPTANTSNVDLYITGTDNPNYQHLIQSSIDVRSTRSVDWDVDLPEDELSDTPYYTFRFIRGGSDYTGPDGEQISSPRIVIRAAASTSTTSSATATSATTTTSSTAPATNTPRPSVRRSRRVSAGAIAGIVIGVVFAIGLIAGLIWFVIGRRRRQRQAVSGPPPPMTTADQPYTGDNREFYATKPSPNSASENKPMPPPMYGQEQAYIELPANSASGRAQLP